MVKGYRQPEVALQGGSQSKKFAPLPLPSECLLGLPLIELPIVWWEPYRSAR